MKSHLNNFYNVAIPICSSSIQFWSHGMSTEEKPDMWIFPVKDENHSHLIDYVHSCGIEVDQVFLFLISIHSEVLAQMKNKFVPINKLFLYERMQIF